MNKNKLDTDKNLFDSYLLNLDPIIKKIRKKYKISPAKNKKMLLKMLKNEFGSENLAYLSLAKYKIQNPEIYRRLMDSYKSDSALSQKNKIKLPIEEKKINKLAQNIKDFEENLIHPSKLVVTLLIEKHKVPNRFKSMFSDYFLYGEFYKEFLNSDFFSFENQNIAMNQDEITGQWYIEIKIFGDTKKKDIIDSWSLIDKMKKLLPDYKSPKSKLRSKIYNKLAKKSVQDLMREIDDDESVELAPTNEYNKTEKKFKTQDGRRRKHYEL